MRVLRHRDFRNLFLGQAASAIGDRVVIVALALFITRQTGSADDLGIVLAAQSLPLIALLLIGGVFADRWPRQRIMVAADLVRCALHAILAVLILAGVARIWEVALIEAVFGAAQAFFQPAYTGLIPQTVPEHEIQDARALTESVSNLAFMLGPALATALVLGIGAGEAFALDAATFLFSAVMVLRVRAKPRGIPAAAESILAGLRGGWREVRSRTWVWAPIASFAVAVLFVYAPWYSLAPVIARNHYGSVGIFGLLEALAGAGAVLGAVVALRWRPRRPLYLGMALTLAWPLQNLLFALGAPVAAMCVLAAATGFGFSLMVTLWETALAHHIPAGALSRVSAWDWMGSLGLLPVGYLLAPPIAEALNPRLILGVGAVIGLASLALGLTPRSVRELGPGPQGAAAAEQPSPSRAIVG